MAVSKLEEVSESGAIITLDGQSDIEAKGNNSETECVRYWSCRFVSRHRTRLQYAPMHNCSRNMGLQRPAKNWTLGGAHSATAYAVILLDLILRYRL
jgi:hypothetical protein